MTTSNSPHTPLFIKEGGALALKEAPSFIKRGNGGVIATLFMLIFFSTTPLSFAAEKNWGGSGDAIHWDDDLNWAPVVAPTAADDVVVNALDAPVIIHQPFNAKTLSVGGNVVSTLTVNEAVSGIVAPAQATDVAVFNGPGGKIILKGDSGNITLRGTYKDSESPLSDEPALVIYFE